MNRLLLAVVVAHAADLGLTLVVLGTYGPAAEANPVMAGALALGPLGGIAMKAGLLAVIFAAAALGPRYRRVLLGGALVGGLIGAASGLVAL